MSQGFTTPGPSFSTITSYLQAPLGIKDSSGNIVVAYSSTASAVNYVTFTNKATGTNPLISATGSDGSLGLTFQTKAGSYYSFTDTSGPVAMRFYNAGNTNYVAFTVGTLSGNTVWTLPTADGSAGKVLQTNGSGVLSFVFQNLVQAVGSTLTITSGTTVIPFDNTLPQNTEGIAIGSQAITPKSATNILEIEVVACVNCVAAASVITLALFQDSGASAISTSFGLTGAANGGQTLVLRYRMTAGTTSSTTFSVRAGGNSASAITIGGYNGGGIYASSASGLITIKEVTP